MTTGQQTSNVTFRGRHSKLMVDVAAVLESGGVSRPRLLSFGCSTGSECLDLAEVMPHAEIFGCEINLKALAEAKENCAGVATVIHSTNETLREAGPFDAVFALNVFCRHPKAAGLDDVSEVYPFSAFDNGLTDLDQHVKPGGVLALYNCQYFFEDTAASRFYEAHRTGAHTCNGWIEKALPNGHRITDVPFSFEGTTYSREDRKTVLKDPVMQQRMIANPGGGRYWHEWRDPTKAEGRSTEYAVWVKNA